MKFQIKQYTNFTSYTNESVVKKFRFWIAAFLYKILFNKDLQFTSGNRLVYFKWKIERISKFPKEELTDEELKIVTDEIIRIYNYELIKTNGNLLSYTVNDMHFVEDENKNNILSNKFIRNQIKKSLLSRGFFMKYNENRKAWDVSDSCFAKNYKWQKIGF